MVDPLSGQPESKQARVALKAVKVASYGVIASRFPLPKMDFLYWCRVPSEYGYHYQVALDEKVDREVWQTQLANALTVTQQLEWLHYDNALTDQQRLAGLSEGELMFALYLQTSPEPLNADWLVEKLAPAVKVSDLERMAILAGSLATAEDRGEIICSCFQVGSKQIQKAVAEGCSSVAELGGRLKCGTNCGSCIPELKPFIPMQVEQSA